MSDYIGISENKMKHMVGVARQCYKVSKILNMSENFCRKMFVAGLNHDIGYEFSNNQLEHSNISADMLEQISCNDEALLSAIRNHTSYTSNISLEWYILTYSDLTIDNNGNEVTIENRLKYICDRYGNDSEQYKSVIRIINTIYDFRRYINNIQNENGVTV